MQRVAAWSSLGISKQRRDSAAPLAAAGSGFLCFRLGLAGFRANHLNGNATIRCLLNGRLQLLRKAARRTIQRKHIFAVLESAGAGSKKTTALRQVNQLLFLLRVYRGSQNY